MGVDRSEFVIVVSGAPRSGTSMMMRMLEAGGIDILTDGLRRADDDNPAGYFEYEPVKNTASDSSWLENADGRAVKIVYSLLPDLPFDFDYRVVFMTRELSEMVASQEVMLGRQRRLSHETNPERWRHEFADELTHIKAWVTRQPNFSVLEVDYNRTLAQPGETVGALDRFLGSGLDLDAMKKVVDPSLYRQRREVAR
jgi:hypothetical protein